jgi:preprotein translocase subunit SecE
MWSAYIASRNEINEMKSYSLRPEFGEGTRMFKFLKNVSREMKKVSWPKGKELTSYTVVVISTVIFMAIFFGVIDLGISQVLNLFFE